MEKRVAHNNNRSYKLPVVSGIIFLFLFGITVWVFLNKSQTYIDYLIVNDIEDLSSIFQEIDRTAGILSFEHQKNYIDFLNVEKFTGSEVGPMNLKYPDKWQGPYLYDNPTIQEKYYQIIRTKKGYFIVPGDGVKLSNDKIIGKDIIFNEDTDIEKMIQESDYLSFEGRPLAAKLDLKPDRAHPFEAAYRYPGMM